ncbi:Arm DNA-binding domain-containing protein [Acinetobacter guillouiae]
MKRSEVKKGKRLSDTVLDNLEPDHVDYRILDGDNLYFRVKTNGTKSWQLRGFVAQRLEMQSAPN